MNHNRGDRECMQADDMRIPQHCEVDLDQAMHHAGVFTALVQKGCGKLEEHHSMMQIL